MTKTAAKKKTATKKAGRPRIPFTPADHRRVVTLSEMGCTLPEIAAVLDCSHDSVQRHFASTLEKGRGCGRMSLRRMQWKAARGGNVTMQIWLGKQLLGQTDRTEISVAEARKIVREELAVLEETEPRAALPEATDVSPAAILPEPPA